MVATSSQRSAAAIWAWPSLPTASNLFSGRSISSAARSTSKLPVLPWPRIGWRLFIRAWAINSPGWGEGFRPSGLTCLIVRTRKRDFLREQLDPHIWWSDRTASRVRRPSLADPGQRVGRCPRDRRAPQTGVCPDAAIGYSLGESAALVALRAWTDRDELLRRCGHRPCFRPTWPVRVMRLAGSGESRPTSQSNGLPESCRAGRSRERQQSAIKIAFTC